MITNNKGFTENLASGHALIRILSVYYFCFEPGLSEDMIKGNVDANKLVKCFGINGYVPSRENEGDRITNTLAAIFFFSSTVPVTGWNRDDKDEMSLWRNSITGLFEGIPFPPDFDEVLAIVPKFIRIMRFEG